MVRWWDGRYDTRTNIANTRSSQLSWTFVSLAALFSNSRPQNLGSFMTQSRAKTAACGASGGARAEPGNQRFARISVPSKMKHFTISFNSPHSLVFCLNKSAKKVESKWTAREHFCPRRHCGSKVCDKCRTFCSAVPAPSCFYTIVDQLWPAGDRALYRGLEWNLGLSSLSKIWSL